MTEEHGKRERIKVHTAAWVLMAVAMLWGKGDTLATYLLALLWHEGAHALCARFMGYQVPQMEWTPFGAVARIEDWYHVPYGRQALIAAAGPIASALGGTICLSGLYALPDGWHPLLIQWFKAHLYLWGFNLLPVLPMDGGRLLWAAFAPRWGRERCASWLSKGGVFAGILLTALSLMAAVCWRIYNLSLAFAGCYLAYAAVRSAQTLIALGLHGMVEKRVQLEQRGVLPVKWLAVSGKQTVREAYRQMESGYFYQYVVVDPVKYRIIGMLSEEQLEPVLLKDQETLVESLLN